MDWLPLRVLKPKMTAAELSRYLLGACGKVIIAQGYRSEKCTCATDVICCCLIGTSLGWK